MPALWLLLALALCLVLAGLAWVTWRQPPHGPPSATALPRAEAASKPGAPASADGVAAGERLDAPRPGQAPATARAGLAAPGVAASAGLAAKAGEPVLGSFGPVCGLSQAEADRFNAAAARPAAAASEPVLLTSTVGRAPFRQAWQRMHQTLANSPGPTERMAAWLLGPLPPDPGGPGEASQRVPAERLLAMLAGSQDLQVLAWGLQVCRISPLGADCDPGLVRRWLRVADDNIVPWLALADAEPGALDEALAGAARARRWDDGHGRLVRAALGAWPADAAPYLLADAALFWLSMEASLARHGPTFAPIRDACRQAVLTGDLARQGWCDAIVRTTVAQAPHRWGQVQGRYLDGALRWPAPEQVRQRRQVAALPPMLRPERMGCGAVADTRAWLKVYAERGEVAAESLDLGAGAGAGAGKAAAHDKRAVMGAGASAPQANGKDVSPGGR